jgi:hypothetical protein
MLVHHDDAARKYVDGPDPKVGTFSESLMAEATKGGWHVISMKNEWKRIVSFDAQRSVFRPASEGKQIHRFVP